MDASFVGTGALDQRLREPFYEILGVERFLKCQPSWKNSKETQTLNGSKSGFINEIPGTPSSCFPFPSSLKRMAADDKTIGLALLLSSVGGFVYYTLWVIVMPFFDDGHPFYSYFPPREYAIAIPVILLIVGLTVVFSFLALVMIKTKKKAA